MYKLNIKPLSIKQLSHAEFISASHVLIHPHVENPTCEIPK
jgi:hypothetical protein